MDEQMKVLFVYEFSLAAKCC